MGRFLLRRGGQAVATLLLATFIVHASVSLLPGDPVRALFGFARPPQVVVDQIRAQYHLDDPYPVQYGLYLWDLVRFDLGRSLRGGSVNDIVAASWVSTAVLVSLALVVQAVLGLAGGLVSTLARGTWWARSILAAASVMVATPVVLSAPWVHHTLTIRWGLLPINPVIGGWKAWILPVLVLAAVTLGTLILFLRSELRQALRAPFVRYAVACGVPRHRVTGLHALRVALPPVVSYMAANLGLVVVAVIVVEGTMNVPGLGSVLLSAIQRQDRSLVVSVVMLLTAAVVVLTMLADLLVAALDPRTRIDAPGGRLA